MRKIQSTIDSCSDCQFAKEFQEKGGNTDFVLICCAEIIVKDETHVCDRFLIDHSSSSLKHNAIRIPDNCPLEDYKPNKIENG